MGSSKVDLTICQLAVNMKLSCNCLSSYLSLHMQLAGLTPEGRSEFPKLAWMRTEQVNVGMIIQTSSFFSNKKCVRCEMVDFELQQRGTMVSGSCEMSLLCFAVG